MPPRSRKPAKPKLSAAERNCKFHCCAISDERKAEISASINEPNPPTYGPACHCGLAGAKEPCTRHG